jgi:hypothetical protein
VREGDWSTVETALARVGADVVVGPWFASFGQRPHVHIFGEVDGVTKDGKGEAAYWMHWMGPCDVALARLAGLSDGAGWDAVYRRFPEQEWVFTEVGGRPTPGLRFWWSKRRIERQMKRETRESFRRDGLERRSVDG